MDRESQEDMPMINEVRDQKGRKWECIPLKVDSVAIDNVIPPRAGVFFAVKETAASKAGNGYRVATGTRIANYGQRDITALRR